MMSLPVIGQHDFSCRLLRIVEPDLADASADPVWIFNLDLIARLPATVIDLVLAPATRNARVNPEMRAPQVKPED